ncbi:hypothetical protein Rcae01_00125 [Novipirellula caenicola]|uniref:Uncharacterized protein n=1 Tax=Novipirellula caenicola TaxID=1536901 RepID=A0ABP9VIT7_9BACT
MIDQPNNFYSEAARAAPSISNVLLVATGRRPRASPLPDAGGPRLAKTIYHSMKSTIWRRVPQSSMLLSPQVVRACTA